MAIEDNSQVTRLGLRHTLTNDGSSELWGLWSHQQTDQAVNYYDLSVPPNLLYPIYGSSSTHSEELQYRRSGATYATQWGVQQSREQLNYWYPPTPYTFGYTQKGQQLYAAWQQTLNPNWQLDVGLGWGKIDNSGNSTSLQHWLPKLGVVYTPDSATHLRLAAWQGMGGFAVGDATLAPVTLAGVLLTRPDDNGKLVTAVSLGGDRQLSSAWLLDAQIQRRKTGAPVITAGPQYLIEQHVDESRLAMHWQPQGNSYIVSLAYDYERIQNDPTFLALDSVDQQNLRSQQLGMRWMASAQCTLNLAWSHNQVAVTQKLYDVSYNFIGDSHQDSFNQADADLSWKFDKSRGLLIAGVRNATDTRFQYSEIDPLNPRFSKGRLMYAKLKMAW
jgi:hypothetical protein